MASKYFLISFLILCITFILLKTYVLISGNYDAVVPIELKIVLFIIIINAILSIIYNIIRGK